MNDTRTALNGRLTIHVGDALDMLRQMPDASIDCVVTSPPYWGLRDYGVGGQIGLEDTPQAFVARLVQVFREVRRVLADDGTCWVNLGDSYAGSWGAQSRPNPGAQGASTLDGGTTLQARSIAAHPTGQTCIGSLKNTPGLKPKDLCGIPWRVALALQADGWWLRQDIIWAKPNPMPESVRDRCTKAHEYVFLLTKSKRYWYDAEAIRETASYPDGPNASDAIASPYGQGFSRSNIGKKGNANGFRGGAYVNGATFNNGDGGKRTRRGNKQRGHGRRHDGFNDRWDEMSKFDQQAAGRNKRSVWSIATRPFSEAHFATMPVDLAEICVKAGCPKGGVVLDPFGGAGTTALAALRHHRLAAMIELNPDYAAMAERRICEEWREPVRPEDVPAGPLFKALG